MNEIDKKLQLKCGIYIITNLLNGKRYVGSSKNLYNRLHEHVHNLNNNKAHNKHLQASWNKYGEDAFHYGILEYCKEDVQFEREQYYIDVLNPEYNFSLNVVANIGKQVSEETCLKISDTLKSKYESGEIKAYRQDHNWIKTYIYNIRTFKIEAECECLADAYRLLRAKKGNNPFNRVYKNRYCLSKEKFNNMEDLVNYISENFLVANSKWGKYIIVENEDGIITYYRELQQAAQENSSSKSTLGKHGNATVSKPYLIQKSKCKFYYSNEYIPITGLRAVPIEESSELLSGNIGETPEKDNTEINSDIKESESSYSVEVETT